MVGDIEKEKKKVELENLGRLVDRYAQSRSLGLLIPLTILVVNIILIRGSVELAMWKPQIWWIRNAFWLVVVWVIASVWLAVKLVAKYEFRFYRKDGKIELEQERVPIWAWAAYALTFVGAAVLNELEMLSVRWALATALASVGVFILYLSKKHKEIILGGVWGLLCLAEAVAAAAGVPVPFVRRPSYFASLMIYIIGSGLITIVMVHIYNRKILRKIKEMRPFGEQHTNKSDT